MGGKRRKMGREGRKTVLNLLLCHIDWRILITTIIIRVDPVPLKFGIKLLQLNYLKVSRVPNQC